MAAVVARWAFAAVYLAVAIIAIWGGYAALNPAGPEPSQFNPTPLPPPLNPQMMVTGGFYILSAIVFLGAAAYAVVRTVNKDGMALVSGLNAAFAGGLTVIGAYLVFLGGFLALGLGGSWYYLVAGLATLAITALMVMRNPLSAKIYAGIIVVTIPWAIWESGLDFVALLPRLAAWIVVGLWFLAPWYRSAMRKTADAPAPRGNGRWVGFAQLAGVLVLALAAMQGYSVVEGTNNNVAGAGVTDWRNYGGVSQGQRFAQLDQINTTNVGQLKEAWRFRTRVPYDNKNTPLMVNDVVYTCTAGNTVIALDADSGSELWRHDSQTVVPGRGLENASTFARTCRSLGYHEAPADYAGECPKRILMGTVDARLLAIDATNGEPCHTFGFDGVVNLKSGLGPHQPGQSMNTSGPLIAGDIAVVGGWVTDNQQLGNVSGVIRAYNAMTGAFAWAWDMGNPGYHGLPDEGGEYTRGTPNVWSLMSYDPELNLLYAPTGNSSPDYFDGELRSEASEKHASAVVAIDAATGEPRWTYQTVHRDIWDWDVPSQPVLVNIRKDGQGEPIPAVAQPTKRGEIFLLDRRTGVPIYDTPERPVPQDPEEGETVTETQPFSPLPHFREDRWEDDMWGLTPLDQLWCRVEFKKMRYDGHFTPPMRGGGGTGETVGTWGGSFQYPGNAGGFNWGSVSVDADNGLLVGAPMLMGNRIVLRSLEDRAKLAADQRARREQAAARRGEQPPAAGGGGGGAPTRPEFDPQRVLYTAGTSPFMSQWRLPLPFLNVGTELPCFEPPYGQIGVIDLNTNKLLWKRPFGSMRDSGPFGIESGLPFMVGTPLQSGSITTRGGLIFHGGAMDSTLRAFDLRTGKVKWEAELPGSAHATPMSYMSSKTGKQYVLITVPNPSWSYPRPPQSEEPTDDQGGYVIAYALPDKPQ
jgi:membrane-bound PQQ-dependent dehydrogenase (glucose/quinate/shikimate family)